MAKRITFGVTYQKYGYVTVELPREIKTETEALEFIKDNWDKVPLPEYAEYVPGSDELDAVDVVFENILMKNQNTLAQTSFNGVLGFIYIQKI